MAAILQGREGVSKQDDSRHLELRSFKPRWRPRPVHQFAFATFLKNIYPRQITLYFFTSFGFEWILKDFFHIFNKQFFDWEFEKQNFPALKQFFKLPWPLEELNFFQIRKTTEPSAIVAISIINNCRCAYRPPPQNLDLPSPAKLQKIPKK